MIAVVQRVSRGEVRIDGREPQGIERGLLILLGVARGDTPADAEWLARKCLTLRIFSDAADKMNLALEDVGGGLLVVSQFTLLGDCIKGRRPSWSRAADPEDAERLYEHFLGLLRRSPHPVATGVFQAKMEVESVNDGPVTLLIDSHQWKGRPGGGGDRTAKAPQAAPCAGEAATGARLLMGRPEPLILASRSPRRAQLLRMLGVAFEIRPPEGDGPARGAGEAPADYVQRQAEAKALAIARDVETGVILGADTIVCLDGEVLEKPRDESQARTYLKRLSGREHEVYTGVALIRAGGGARASGVERSQVRFAELDDQVIATYVASGEPLDKAGAYGIQGLGGLLVTAVEGCYFNVMGLPLARLRTLFGELADT